MKPYIHYVQYDETDKMGITHPSNSIRWIEEARVDFLVPPLLFSKNYLSFMLFLVLFLCKNLKKMK